MASRVLVKIADRMEEFEQIHRFNHEIFSSEVQQYAAGKKPPFTDIYRFKTRYAIALRNGIICALVAFSETRPFSIDYRIQQLDKYLPAFDHALEIRLISAKPGKRGDALIRKMVSKVAEWHLMQDKENKCILALGNKRQVKIFEELGFVSFYKLIRNDDIWYQPMYLDTHKFTGISPGKLRVGY
jgi:hypothetical protein